jgi:hypothetical protein
MLGVPLQTIDENPAEASVSVGELMGERSIYLLKPDTDQSYAANVVAYARSVVPHGSPAIILLDSVQTILARKPSDDTAPESPRLAAKTLVTSCRAWAEAHNFTFILTSQANRAFYRSKKEDENSAAIAAFSESGAIEYMADVAIVLSLPDEKTEIVKVRFVKNRLKGTAKTFQVRYSPDTGRLAEVDEGAAEDAERAQRLERIKPVRDAVLENLEASADGLSTTHLAELCGVRKAEIVSTIAILKRDRLVFPKKSGRQILYFKVAGR